MSSLKLFTNAKGIEYVIHEITGEAFATVRGYARMSGKAVSTVSARINGVQFDSIKTAEVLTPGGLQGVRLIPAKLCFKWLIKDNPDLAFEMGEAGATVYIHLDAGFKISSTATQQTRLEISEDHELGSLLNFNKEELTIPQQIKLLDLILQYLKIGHDSMAYAIAQALGIRLVAEASDNVALATRVTTEIRQCIKQEIKPPEVLTEYVNPVKVLTTLKNLMTTKEIYEFISGKKGNPTEIGQLGVKLKIGKAKLHSNYGGKKVYLIDENTLNIAKQHFENLGLTYSGVVFNYIKNNP